MHRGKIIEGTRKPLGIDDIEAGSKMSVTFYNDPVLNDVMKSLVHYERTSVISALNKYIAELQKPLMVVDARCLIARGILSVIVHNCSVTGKKCSLDLVRAQVEKIVNAIIPSLRWKAFGRAFWKWLDEFNLNKAQISDLKRMNEFEELFLGLVSFTLMETREKSKTEQSFRKFARKTGFENYEELANASNVMVDFERLFEKKPMLYDERAVFEMISQSGFNPTDFILGEENIDGVKLSEMDQRLIPIFYGGRRGIRIGVQWQPLSIFNLPTRLCFSLRSARRNIIEGAYKGTIFEDYLCNVLTGRLLVAIDVEDPLGGHTEKAEGVKGAPGGQELLKRLDDSFAVLAWHTLLPWRLYLSRPKLDEKQMKSLKLYKYVRYAYEYPAGQKTCNILIRLNTHSSFKSFFEKERCIEWEEDILLLHKKEPKHALIGQAKFTRHYNHGKYCAGRKHVKKLVKYIEANEAAKAELRIPKDFPVVPVMFTSYTGSLHQKEDEMLVTTIFPVLRGRFRDQVCMHVCT